MKDFLGTSGLSEKTNNLSPLLISGQQLSMLKMTSHLLSAHLGLPDYPKVNIFIAGRQIKTKRKIKTDPFDFHRK